MTRGATRIDSNRFVARAMNQDEFLKCLELSKSRYAEGDLESALRLAVKAQRMSECKETTEWLEKVRNSEIKSEDNKEDQSSDKPTVRQRQNIPEKLQEPQNLQKSRETSQNSYSPEQLKDVKTFMKSNKDDYYKVLGVEKSASQDEIKKAYKKLALKFHPDKNQAPGADEAFKVIAVAFSVLGDEDKRRNFDRFGSSANSMNSNGFNSSFASTNFNFNGSEEISPEDLFNLFFGSAFSQGHGQHNPFNNHFAHNNPFTQGQFGPGQFFFSSNFNGMRPPQQQQRQRRSPVRPENENEEFLRKIIQFVPLIIVFFLSIVSSWLFPDDSSNSNANSNTDHLFSLNPSGNHRFPRNTRLKNVPYYATSTFHNYFKNLKENETSKLSRELASYESVIVNKFIKGLKQNCEQEERQLAKLLKKAKSNQIDEIKTNFKLNSCEKLKTFE